MKKLTLLLILTSLILTSCTTAKRCAKRFPPQIITVTKDSIRTEIQYRDTTIYIKLPVEKITVFDTIYIKNGVIQFKEIKASTNYADARAWIGQNRINLELTDKDTTLAIKLSNAIKTARYWESRFSTEQKVLPPEKFIPLFVKIFAWIGGFCIIGFAVWLLFKFTK